MTPRLTSVWRNRANQVVSYITANPGVTGKEIAYATGVALSTVHKIIAHDPRANQMAWDGKIAVVDLSMKPRWYKKAMTKVPMLSVPEVNARFHPGAEFKDMIDDQKLDPKAHRLVSQVADMVALGIATPGRSIVQRRKEAVAIVSNAQILAKDYTTVKTQNDAVIPRLAQLESMVRQLTSTTHRAEGQLTTSAPLDDNAGKSQLRKTVRS